MESKKINNPGDYIDNADKINDLIRILDNNDQKIIVIVAQKPNALALFGNAKGALKSMLLLSYHGLEPEVTKAIEEVMELYSDDPIERKLSGKI